MFNVNSQNYMISSVRTKTIALCCKHHVETKTVTGYKLIKQLSR